VIQLFGPNLGSLEEGITPPPNKWPFQSEIFELLNIESWNSKCKKLFVRQLFGPNLGVLGGWTPQNGPSKKFFNCLTKKVETHNVGSYLWDCLDQIWGSWGRRKIPDPPKTKCPFQSENFELLNVESWNS